MKKDLILQVNIPFCTRRCAYCGSTVCAYDPSVSAAYVKALLREIEAAAPEAQDHRVRAVSLEGGCPTLLEPAGLQTVLRAIRHSFALAEDVQISLQTMPGDYSRALMEKIARDENTYYSIAQQMKTESDETLSSSMIQQMNTPVAQPAVRVKLYSALAFAAAFLLMCVLLPAGYMLRRNIAMHIRRLRG